MDMREKAENYGSELCAPVATIFSHHSYAKYSSQEGEQAIGNKVARG